MMFKQKTNKQTIKKQKKKKKEEGRKEGNRKNVSEYIDIIFTEEHIYVEEESCYCA